jgi:hypothetical protein
MCQHLINHKLDDLNSLDNIFKLKNKWALIATCHHIIGV